MYMSHLMHIVLVENESIALYLKMELHFIIANIRQQRAAHTFTTLIVDSVYICITNVMQSWSAVPSDTVFRKTKKYNLSSHTTPNWVYYCLLSKPDKYPNH